MDCAFLQTKCLSVFLNLIKIKGKDKWSQSGNIKKKPDKTQATASSVLWETGRSSQLSAQPSTPAELW